MTTENEEYIVIWEAPVIVPPEFRLYYDDKGKVVCYTCEKLEGNYIVIDAQTFAEGRYDLRVLDGRIIKDSPNSTIVRLTPSNFGYLCAAEDLSIIVSIDDDVQKKYWELIAYEFK